MPRTRKNYAPSLKAKVALEAIRGVKTVAQIAQANDVHPNLVANWKKHALDNLSELFATRPEKQEADADRDQLFQRIGRLKVELDFLKKRAGLPH
jgi:transposase